MGLFSFLTGNSNVKNITVSDLKEELKSIKGKQFIDVRTRAEYNQNHIRQFSNMPLQTLQNNIKKLDKEQPVYVICQSGGRSANASQILAKSGFEKVYNIRGGMMSWNSSK